ncbi:MAG: type VI secretion system-associated protein TagF [Rhizobacter sp.]|nr:type VI secretion system-associated protein TagF [Rhizobacter sp.]
MNESTLLQLLEGTGVEAPGWYGKLPMLGDFASRRLPQSFVDACDHWLARGIEASRAQLGERWLDVYLTGPIWRFAWAPGVVDAQWWLGVMMPSVDKVGRYFPLLIARSVPALPGTGEGLNALQAWYAHLGAVALGSLRPGATLDEFETTLARAPAFGETAHVPPAAAAPLPGRVRHTLPGAASLLAWAQGLMVGEALQRFAGQSLWWPDHAESPDNSLSVAQGLPPPQHFAELLEGRW